MRLETTTKRYIGLSTDRKPELEEQNAGSSFLEEDTGVVVRWTGRTWTVVPPGFDHMAEMTVLQRRTNELLELIVGQLG